MAADKFCSRCGSALEPGDKFCASCGAPVEAVAPPPPEPEPEAPAPSPPASEPEPVPEPEQAVEPEPAAEPPQEPEPEPQSPPPPPPLDADGAGKKRSGGGKSKGRKWFLRIAVLIVVLGLGAAYWFVVVEPALAEREEMLLYLNRVEGLAFSPDGGRLAVGTDMGDMGILDLTGGQFLTVFPSTHPAGGFQSVAWGDKGMMACGYRDGSRGIIELWRLKGQGITREKLKALSWKPKSNDRLQEVASFLGFTPNGKYLVVFDATDNMVRVWNASGKYGAHKPNPIAIGTEVKATSLDIGGYRILAAVTRKGSVLLWGKNKFKPKSGTALVRRSGDNWTGASNVVVAPDGSWLAYDTPTYGDEWNRSLIFHPVKGGSERVVALNEFGNKLRSACVSPDGKLVAVSFDNRVRVLDAATGNAVYTGEVVFRTAGSPLDYIIQATFRLIDL
ncbi:zinc-ribbon domain-containing protein [Pseudodesulfovibrio cashew]|uniref:Zinc-ribbon domain-containing protein n=1 Tax=Pseudodesulfovibrio cashew TaxID=2678688 RepID=A0A6I6JC32_9BACT|nr:zinc-ribbon domain-containing protein [Pseudodesulfovibrio cashew]QGY38689.1 zinc-ribbon domain-containing protein [Pseudodesulfovibrio cashew]